MSKKLKNTKLVIDWLDWWGRGGTISERSTSLAERLFAPVETFFEEGFRHLADGSVVISSALKKRALALGVGADHLIRLPFGADTENLTPRHKNEARRRLGLAADQPLLGYLGNISFVNDRNLLLESFRLLGERNRNIHLILIGRSGIQDSDIDPDLRPNIVKTGALSYEALQDYIAACDLMLLPLKNSIANRGRWPSKIGDYLAAGRPVVSCKVGDIAELFANQPIGLLTNDNPYDFAAGVLELLESRDINDMGRNARNVAETSLAWNILTDRLESFYYKILYQN
jgi:glycosyltransferase involved in cell wall biosynthesis